MADTLLFVSQFTKSGNGVSGLTDVLCRIVQRNRSTGARTLLNPGGSAATPVMEIDDSGAITAGLYEYALTTADIATYDYEGAFSTAGPADLLIVPALWVYWLTGSVSAPVASVAGNVAGTVLGVTGNVAGNVNGNVVGNVNNVNGNVGGNIIGNLQGNILGAVAPSWYTAPVDVSANVTEIKAKTDLLTFTGTLLKVDVIDWDSLVVHAITFDGANYPLTAVRVWADPSVGNKYVHVVNSGLGYLQVYVATNADKTGYSLDSSYDPAKTTAQAATALTNLTWTDAKAAFIDAPISGCSTLTAAQVWVNATRTLSAFAFTVLVDMTEDVPTSNAANTLGDCLNAARAQGFGNWTLNLITKVLTLYAADGVTVVHSFTLDSVTAPTQRIT